MSGKWKDLLMFNKRQRNGIVVLSLLICISMITPYFMSNFTPYLSTPTIVYNTKELNSFLAQIGKDSFEYTNPLKRQTMYISQGDTVPTMYGVHDGIIAQTGGDQDLSLMELNTSDTTQLIQLSGIGHYYAKEIVDYRNALGGYHNLMQLFEVERMREETALDIIPYFWVDTNLIVKIHLNTAGVYELVKHPYITWNMAKAIYAHQRFEKKIHYNPGVNRLEFA